MQTPPTSADESLPAGVRPLRAEDPAEIGGYPLLGRLGHGGMGVVYLGRGADGALVAVKTAYGELATDEDLVHRYAAEAVCLRRAPEGHVARLVADGSAHRPPYVVTEFLDARSLAQTVRADGPLCHGSLRALAAGVARALAAVHDAGLIHRDVKPANILLTSTGPRLIDFGIARQVGDAGGPTTPGMVVGSPGWIPPERLEHLPATPASDVFGWGCAVAFAATGRNPFGTGDPDLLAQRTVCEPPDLDGLDGSLRGPVAQALSKSPAGRPTAAELLAWLDWTPAGRTPPDESPRPRATTGPGMPHTGDREYVPPRRGDREEGRHGTRDMPPYRGRPPVAGSVAVAATASVALVTFLLATSSDHGRNVTPPPAGNPPTAPSNAAVTHRVNPPRTRSVPRPSPSGRPTAERPAAPRAEPTTSSAAPSAGNKGKGKGKGRGKGGPGG